MKSTTSDQQKKTNFKDMATVVSYNVTISQLTTNIANKNEKID